MALELINHYLYFRIRSLSINISSRDRSSLPICEWKLLQLGAVSCGVVASITFYIHCGLSATWHVTQVFFEGRKNLWSWKRQYVIIKGHIRRMVWARLRYIEVQSQIYSLDFIFLKRNKFKCTAFFNLIYLGTSTPKTTNTILY